MPQSIIACVFVRVCARASRETRVADTVKLLNGHVLGRAPAHSKDAVANTHHWIRIPRLTLWDKIRVYQVINSNHCVRRLLRDFKTGEAGLGSTQRGCASPRLS